jgi:hypothetical protein
LIVLSVLVAALVLVPAALASQVVVANTNVSNITLGVNAKGEAMLSYIQGGKQVRVLASSAVNAIAPAAGGKQTAFTLAYDGGYKQQYTSDPECRAGASATARAAPG